MKANQDKTSVIHGLENLQEFVSGGHNLIVPLLILVAVKCLAFIHHKGVEKYMGNFI